MHDPDARSSLAPHKRAKAKAQDVSQAGHVVLWAGIGLGLALFMSLQSF